MCRADFHGSQTVPDLREDPEGWFDTIDENNSGTLEPAEVYVVCLYLSFSSSFSLSLPISLNCTSNTLAAKPLAYIPYTTYILFQIHGIDGYGGPGPPPSVSRH